MHMFQNKEANKIRVSSKKPLKISSYFGCRMKTAVAIQNDHVIFFSSLKDLLIYRLQKLRGTVLTTKLQNRKESPPHFISM